MSEVDREVLTRTIAHHVEFLKQSHPSGFYSPGSIVQPYHIFLKGKQDEQDERDRLEGKKVKPRKPSSITVTEIQREVEVMIGLGMLSNEFSWLDPRAIAEREKRIKEQEERYGV